MRGVGGDPVEEAAQFDARARAEFSAAIAICAKRAISIIVQLRNEFAGARDI